MLQENWRFLLAGYPEDCEDVPVLCFNFVFFYGVAIVGDDFRLIKQDSVEEFVALVL